MVGPLGVLPTCPGAPTTEVEDVDGGPTRGCCRQVQQRPPPKLKMSMVGPLGVAAGMSDSSHHRSLRRQWWAPLGVLPAGPVAVTTKIEDINGGAPRECCRHVRQRPPPKLETSMAGPLGVLPTCPAAATTEVGDVNGRPSGGCWRQVRQWPPPKLETSMAGPWGLLPVSPAAATTGPHLGSMRCKS
jgi:hypothetical protein